MIDGCRILDHQEFYLSCLPEFLDANGDLAPPWERFPVYHRYTIGWRMGDGEDWFGMWHVFLGKLDPTFETRLAYLRRHPPAPFTWFDFVHAILYPDLGFPDRENREKLIAVRNDLHQLGLIASDAAYTTWRSQQQNIEWPWERFDDPQSAARHFTRELWFWSRFVSELRSNPDWRPPVVPDSWQSCAAALASGQVPSPNSRKGLLTLAQMLAAGKITPPWQLGLRIKDFKNTFDDDMNYVDAFRLWGMSSLDDPEQLRQYLATNNPPEDWENWCASCFQGMTLAPPNAKISNFQVMWRKFIPRSRRQS